MCTTCILYMAFCVSADWMHMECKSVQYTLSYYNSACVLIHITFPLRDHNNKWYNPSKELRYGLSEGKWMTDTLIVQCTHHKIKSTKYCIHTGTALHSSDQTNLFTECKYLKIEMIFIVANGRIYSLKLT